MKKYEKMLLCIIITTMIVTLFGMTILGIEPFISKIMFYSDASLWESTYYNMRETSGCDDIEQGEEELKIKANSLPDVEIDYDAIETNLDGQISNKYAFFLLSTYTYLSTGLIYGIYFWLTIIGIISGYLIYLIFIEKKKMKSLIVPFIICAIISVLITSIFLEDSLPDRNECILVLVPYMGLCITTYIVNLIYCKIMSRKLNKELKEIKDN